MKLLLIFSFICLSSCGKKELINPISGISKNQTSKNLSIIYGSMNNLNVKVFYEPEAVPSENKSTDTIKTWDILKVNLEKVWAQRTSQKVTFSIPTKKSEMIPLPKLNRNSWSLSDLLELGKSKTQIIGPSTVDFSIFYLKGNFVQDGVINDKVLGLNIGGTTYIFIFYDVITKVANENTDTKRSLEQFTIVHEFGHALGLVNNGVDDVSGHHDEKHGAHCLDPNCVMYWSNEGHNDLRRFITTNSNINSLNLYDNLCLKDIKSY